MEHLYHFHANGELFLDDVTSFERFGDDVEPNDISDKEAVERTFRQSIYELVGLRSELLFWKCYELSDRLIKLFFDTIMIIIE